MTIQEYLQRNKLITDGSFGTYYVGKYQTDEIPEAANTEYPDRVSNIHHSYIEAGARLIRTNTFASNTVLLSSDWASVEQNIRAAIQLAKDAVKSKDIFIAGDIGPIPDTSSPNTETDLLAEEYYQIARIFAEEGIQVLTFETFPDMEHILPAISRIKKEYPLFIMMQFCVDQFGYSASGLSAKKLLEEAASVPEIDAIGLNCGVGPGHMNQIYGKVDLHSDKYLIALPNAGYPKRLRGRQIFFNNNTDYFTEKMTELSAAGVDILGGCCGTNPSFIKAISSALDIRQSVKSASILSHTEVEAYKKKSGFFCQEDGTVKDKKLIAVELAPPVSANDEKLLEAAHFLRNEDVDVLTFPDSPSGRTRIDSVLMAEKIRRSTGMCVMPHICCRDKNAIAMRSLILGAHINDIHNLLIITGDPIPSLARQTVKSVFNFDSVGLMKIVRDMNQEYFPDAPMVYGGAINQGRRNIEVEIKRVKRKMEVGAEFFLTQPVFSKNDADRVRYIKESTGARILCGIMPLISRKNASFMKNEIAGVDVTDEIIQRYPEHGTKEEGEAVGVAIAREIIEYTKDFADGYYFSFPFNRVHLLKEIRKSL
ncbi:bifunctional homocysteine S-methyltransferase/methylenetetrahydrofolate reductase [Bariatricus sp. SGI.161]|uniref:bifunctional homocysteine S-methyltransferase/methylenetetrahydrofolate reductase n=1 Tax=Bariatricus sp. SGI.161 TaxID=3420550 RepID=UPI003D00F7F7